jgi:hypothetical protein
MAKRREWQKGGKGGTTIKADFRTEEGVESTVMSLRASRLSVGANIALLGIVGR